jgi:hypothetical protein
MSNENRLSRVACIEQESMGMMKSGKFHVKLTKKDTFSNLSFSRIAYFLKKQMKL